MSAINSGIGVVSVKRYVKSFFVRFVVGLLNSNKLYGDDSSHLYDALGRHAARNNQYTQMIKAMLGHVDITNASGLEVCDAVMSSVMSGREVDIELIAQIIDLIKPAGADIYASQEGEDILIRRILKGYYDRPGFYVDVGAHDPIRFSNTFHYYIKGWRGINIDPVPGMKDRFDMFRPGDINLEMAISDSEGVMPYFVFEEPAYNTFSESRKAQVENISPLEERVMVPVLRLSDVLSEHIDEGAVIDFLSVDVEGFELKVLSSSDWDKYRPRLVCVEALDEHTYNDVNSFLADAGYLKVASTKNSHIFIERAFSLSVQ